MKLRYAFEIIPRHGEAVSGDAVLAEVHAESARFAIIDALGHGEVAHRVAQRGLAVLQRLPESATSVTALETLQTELRGTRGAAVTICSLRGLNAEIVGIGNVACRTIGAPMPFVPKPGVVGGTQKTFVATRILLHPGQRLILHSDGISHRFDQRNLSLLTLEESCALVMRHHRYPHDDASVLIIEAGALGAKTP